MHKFGNNVNVNQLSIRPIVSNIAAGTYYRPKQLSKVVSPLRSSEYTIKNTEELLIIHKKEKISSQVFKQVLSLQTIMAIGYKQMETSKLNSCGTMICNFLKTGYLKFACSWSLFVSKFNA